MKTNLSCLRLTVAGILLLISLGVCSAQVTEMLYSTPTGTLRDNYTGVIGCQFQLGTTNVVVSHLGIFGTSSGLAVSHNAGVFSITSTNPLGQVVVPAGTSAYFTNGFWWVALDPPLLLNSNTSYIVGGTVGNGDGDGWQDAFTATWNTFFVGSTATTTRSAVYGPGVVGWPPTGFSQNGSDNTYGNVCVGYIEVGQARVGVQTTNVSVGSGATLSVNGFGTGQQPITYQWWLAPNTPLNNQTNAILNIPNVTTGNSGTYYLTASNSLGGEQSASVTVTVTAFPVGISQQPTNTTVFQNYPATFSMMATGTPPISLQWSRNGNAIAGATITNYTLTAALTNNGDVYSCLASNYLAPTSYTATSSNATLTVLANQAQPQEFLHGARNLATNNFSGLVGGHFTVGNSPVLVTHLGYFANGGTNLAMSHHVGIFSANGSVLYGSVLLPAGNYPDATGTYTVTNGYEWAPLYPPLVLSNNTQYLLVAEVFSGSDPWGDAYHIPDLNPYFATTVDATYWGAAWPNAGAAGDYSGQMYSAPNMAILALHTPAAYISPTNVTQYAGFNTTFTAAVDGQAPVTVQWYEEPGTPFNGQTNLTLTLTNLNVGESGNYYVVATNYVTGANAKSADATLTVLADVGPSITNDIQPQTVFQHQTVQFTVGASGTPPLSYVWTFNGNPIPGATNSTLTLNNISTANVGNYQVTVSNSYGPPASSSSVGLGVTIPAWGSYPSAVMSSDLLLYCPLNESSVNSGGIATNWGSLGFADNGTYEGSINSSVAGPTNLNFANNTVVSLDGFDGYVQLPPLADVLVSNITIAAWVNDTYPNSGSGFGQVPNAAIFFQRSTYVFGLSVNPVASTNEADQLRGTWNGNFFDSFLVLPTNQWALAALVISPTNRALYLDYGNGLHSTNFAVTNSSATFDGNSEIGWDTAGGSGGRLWQGPIGDVMVFDQAFSPAAINALYLGVPPSATLTIARAGANLTVAWPGGTLLEATSILGPWTPTVGATNGVYTFTPSGTAKFYRVQLQP